MASRRRNNPAYIRHEALAAKDLLDIGPGKDLRENFITVDFKWRRGLDVCWDITKGLPLPNESVSGVFTEHCLEHVPLESGDLVIGEIYRVLKPGGRVRIVVPDAQIFLTRYAKWISGEPAEPLPFMERDDFHGIYQPIMSVNRIFRNHGHQFIYDFPMLDALLRRNRFGEIVRQRFNVGGDERLLVDKEDRSSESLYAEAVKPA